MHRADKQFTIEYNYAGKAWGMEIWADDAEDAMRKLRAAGTNGRVLGEVQMVIKFPNWTERVFRWLGFGNKP